VSHDGLPTTYQPSRVRVVAGLGAVALVALATWWYFDRLYELDVEPVVIEVVDETELMLAVSCAENVTARVSETDDAIRVEDVDGTPIDGDCGAGVTLRLSSLLGDRRVFVEGEDWVRHVRCIAPPELNGCQ
jgi:hypothetical protein